MRAKGKQVKILYGLATVNGCGGYAAAPRGRTAATDRLSGRLLPEKFHESGNLPFVLVRTEVPITSYLLYHGYAPCLCSVRKKELFYNRRKS